MGRKADFRNTIVLLTSNLGARFLAGQNAPLGFDAVPVDGSSKMADDLMESIEPFAMQDACLLYTSRCV